MKIINRFLTSTLNFLEKTVMGIKIAVLLGIVLFTIVIASICSAGELEIKPYFTTPISNSENYNLTHGCGLEGSYSWDNGFLSYASYDFNPLEYQSMAMGNLNLAVLGIGYQKQWEHWAIFLKGGYCNAHDSDLEKIMPDKSIISLSFGKGWVIEPGIDYRYPINEACYIGIGLSGRKIWLDDFELVDVKGVFKVGIDF